MLRSLVHCDYTLETSVLTCIIDNAVTTQLSDRSTSTLAYMLNAHILFL